MKGRFPARLVSFLSLSDSSPSSPPYSVAKKTVGNDRLLPMPSTYLTLAIFLLFAFAYVLLAELYQLVLYVLFQLQ